MPADRFSTATRLRALGSQTAERVYRAQSRRRVRAPRRSRLTGRAALLALVVCSMVVALAYPMRQYISQRADIEDERRQVQETGEQVRDLRELKARWQDQAFVEQQARRHLHFVRPGETSYILPDGTAESGLPQDHGGTDRPWYEKLWSGVDEAD
ncbi:septum formation initiator family protein [Streptomyces sp. N2-109]|uniref:Septum formation initiator family protein n=1 Tax=Streptomyces gossypii TaxID=2883101 RepID=A0ABT2K0G6_9ACTN|nr:septum formation initiator family protein [Streptomyces gossypii]MCT2592959.1 septum formation initiator family protein [Streptomyces gossypii]MCT2593692.1 septum formation initiator family protein [Streptomyces gossypii]